MAIEVGKIFVRSIVGIITIGIVTILVGHIIDPQIMCAFYLAVGTYIYIDKNVSGDIPK